MNSKKEAVKNIRSKIMGDLSFKEELSDSQMRELISNYLLKGKEAANFTLKERKQIGKEIFDSLRKMNVLQDLLENEEITEIMVNGPDHVFIEKKGTIEKSDITFESKEVLMQVINQIASSCNRVINESSPIVDARLMTGERVNAVLYPIALNGPILTIRRFPKIPMTMDKLIQLEAINKETSNFLKKAVIAGYNIIVSGGTGSGKTSFLNALSEYIPAKERVITIEDSAELQLRGVNNLIRMETRTSNIEGGKVISIRDLIRTSLRMRPDRIVVGEVRGAEAMDMIGSAMNCGHDGSMSTAHANSAADMLSRLENMFLMAVEIPVDAIRRQIASGLDLIIHLGRLRDGSRKVLEIIEIEGIKHGEILLNPIYKFVENKNKDKNKVEGEWVKVGELVHKFKMENAGIMEIY